MKLVYLVTGLISASPILLGAALPNRLASGDALGVFPRDLNDMRWNASLTVNGVGGGIEDPATFTRTAVGKMRAEWPEWTWVSFPLAGVNFEIGLDESGMDWIGVTARLGPEPEAGTSDARTVYDIYGFSASGMSLTGEPSNGVIRFELRDKEERTDAKIYYEADQGKVVEHGDGRISFCETVEGCSGL